MVESTSPGSVAEDAKRAIYSSLSSSETAAPDTPITGN